MKLVCRKYMGLLEFIAKEPRDERREIE